MPLKTASDKFFAILLELDFDEKFFTPRRLNVFFDWLGLQLMKAQLAWPEGANHLLLYFR